MKDDKKKLPITYIFVAPGLDFEHEEKELSLLLTNNGYKVGQGDGQVNIKPSQIPYRA